METYAWVMWIVLGVALIVAEIFTTGFVLLWFGLAAILAALAAWLGFGFAIQVVIFLGVSALLTVLSRTIFSNMFIRAHEDKVKTGVDAMPGQIGTVTSASKGALNSGEVKVFGSTWTAYPEDGEEPLADGDKVEVSRVVGASIYVRKVRELKGWQGD